MTTPKTSDLKASIDALDAQIGATLDAHTARTARRSEVRRLVQTLAAEAQQRRDETPDPFAGTHLARRQQPTKESPR